MSWWAEEVLRRDRWGPIAEPVLERLVRARDRGRFPHAVLLVGPPRQGRELTAVEAAVMVTCSGAERPWSTSNCADRIRRGVHPDVIAVLPQPPSNQIKIDQVRGVVETAAGRPYEGLHRVWIFDGVEVGRFGAEAANAFLKTLEEPPEHVRFLLLAANPASVLPTIRSRCQRLTLPGSVAVAVQLGIDAPVELAAVALDGVDIEPCVEEIRGALEGALEGRITGLLTMPSLDSDATTRFEQVAAVAVALAAEQGSTEIGGELSRLAVELLATQRRAHALNLNSDRQLSSCLLRWYRSLPAS